MPSQDDTTQTGVSAETENAPTSPEIMTDETNPRRAGVLADVAEKRREQLAEEGWKLPEAEAEEPAEKPARRA